MITIMNRQTMNLMDYHTQLTQWPTSGRHLLAHYTDDAVVVYQAYNHQIANFAVQHQRFGGAFSFQRMSWIKPNVLWMMFRSGWGQKPNQERTLAIYLKRAVFDQLLLDAFPSSNTLGLSDADWRQQIESTDVRLQWDPDHDPYGKPIERRAIQLGLRRQALAGFAGDSIIQIVDRSDWVAEQYQHVQAGRLDLLMLPEERIYPLTAAQAHRLGLYTDSPKAHILPTKNLTSSDIA